MQRNVRRVNDAILTIPKFTRVAAYARVSSGKEAMLHSLSAQVSYYSSRIQAHPGWRYVGVYADEALTGTKDTRENFQRLLAACRAGEIDLIITKSISRFARNTVTLLETVRELKQLGIDVFFEEQNIHTMSADGELLMTILASYAQEESRSASENQKWRIKANFKNGLPWNGTILGYRIEDGIYVPDETEAKVVRQIFDWYEEGVGFYTIAKRLNEAGIRTRKGNAWCQQSLQQLVRTYAYTGNLLLQTTYISDHITKKSCKNRGQLPMYHCEDSHDPIIPMEQFEAVQAERKERAKKYAHNTGKNKVYPFTSKLVCQGCGKNYRRKVVTRGPAWICSTFNTRGKAYCPTSKQIPEDTLMAVTAKVLGIPVFDEATFLHRIAEIRVGEQNTLTYIFIDGSSTVTTWADRSRRESWTPSKREAARQVALQQEPLRRHPDGRFQKKDIALECE